MAEVDIAAGPGADVEDMRVGEMSGASATGEVALEVEEQGVERLGAGEMALERAEMAKEADRGWAAEAAMAQETVVEIVALVKVTEEAAMVMEEVAKGMADAEVVEREVVASASVAMATAVVVMAAAVTEKVAEEMTMAGKVMAAEDMVAVAAVVMAGRVA